MQKLGELKYISIPSWNYKLPENYGITGSKAKEVANELFKKYLPDIEGDYELLKLGGNMGDEKSSYIWYATYYKKYGDLINPYEKISVDFVPTVNGLYHLEIQRGKFENNEIIKTKEEAIEIAKAKDKEIEPNREIENIRAEERIEKMNSDVYLREKDKSRDNIMCSALEPAYFVPETVKADVLFRNMKQTHNTFAVVLDEYGGLTGVVTIQDLIEKLVGELQENPSISETAEPQIRQIDCDTWEISGNAELDEIERAIGVTFDTEYINTFTGYIFDRLKGIPDDGQTNIELKLDNISVTIKEIKDHQVVLAEIKRIDHSIEKQTQK